MKKFLSLGLLLLAVVYRSHAQTNLSLLANGDFESGAVKPSGWPMPAGATWEKEDGNHFLRLHAEEPGKTVLVYLAVPIKSEYKALELSYRVRSEDIKREKQLWFDGRIMMNFKDANKKTVKPSPAPPVFRDTKTEWETRSQKFLVPVGATLLEIMPCLFQAASGTLDFDDFRLTPIDASEVPPPPPPPPVIQSDTMTWTNAASLPPELHVDGNQLKTKAGQVVWLQGLSVDSMQWAMSGEHILQTIPVAIEQWKANVIRLPVIDSFWFGQPAHNQKAKDGGLRYRKLVDDAIQAAASRGAYVALDLHVFGAPTEKHVTFWKDASTRYMNHPAVLFELFNEPHSISWNVWRDGGSLKEKHTDVNPAESKEEITGEKSTGMQALVDAVRATGAKNIVIAGGLDWGYDLSGVIKDQALTDRDGNGIMYSSHLYPWKKDWQSKTLDAAKKYPIFVGEVGCPPDYAKFTFIPEKERYPLEGWAPDVLGLIQKYKLNWTGFSFHPKCGPMVILDWDYTPTPYWGVYVKQALQGEKFEVKKMR